MLYLQRLSMARLLLKTNAKIWMLDEPTTGLDIEHTTQMMNYNPVKIR
jgi:ATP-binding cassette subfamily C protein CydC